MCVCVCVCVGGGGGGGGGGGASCLELLLTPLGGSVGMLPQEIFGSFML